MTAAPEPVRTLVVEDEPLAAQAHAQFVRRVPGFEVVGVVGTGEEALHTLARTRVDLVLLDMNLPDMHGLAVCRAMRAAGYRADVVAVTSARDLEVVQSAVSAGVVQYLLKPFVFASLRDRLERYAAYRAELAREADGGPRSATVSGQDQVDRLLGQLHSVDAHPAPKGLAAESAERVIAALRDDGPLTATELGRHLGLSRVAARRYLERLAERGLARRAPRYGGPGRPEIEYTWHQPPRS
ncbi:response regulator [Spongisporangium articulatum]|uniref:Transcriptional regulatory protein n=1 Tax=Spongisporangium articulatum TaxID=3362603 RepID=A0ABW8ANI1_9ACTN